ncbi:polysaccharide biosynthesis protein [Pseudomonas aeruginosa]|nr:polysaccharide biosynthesis protein [Pseudomonas aeruginosa]
MLGKHSLVYFLFKSFPAILTLVGLSVFTRLLSPGEYGVYSLTIIVVGFLNTVFLQWVALGVGRYLPECSDDQARARLLGTARAISFLVSLVIIFVTFLLWEWREEIGFSILYYMVGFLCLAQAWHDLNLKIQNAILQPLTYGKMLLIKGAGSFFIGVLLVYFGFGVDGLLLGTLVSLVLATIFFQDAGRGVSWALVDKEQLTRLFAYGAPLTLTFLFAFIVNASDRFFIGAFLGDAAVGVYSVSYDLAQYSVGTVASVVHLAAFPLVMEKLSKSGLPQTQDQLRKTFIFIFAVVSPAACGLAMVAPEISGSIMGEEFREGALKIIPLISLSAFLGALKSFYFDYSFQLASATRVQVVTVAVSAVVDVVFNLILIPEFGIVGAAVSSVMAFSSAILISIFLGRRVFPMPALPGKDAMKIALSVLLMAVSVASFSLESAFFGLVVKVDLGGGVYLAAMIALDVSGMRTFLKSKLIR